jgi:hypothetical protein
MSDKEKLISLFDEFGIGWSAELNDIVCEQGNNKVEGYAGFFTYFQFDADGKFICMGAGE